MADPFIGEIRMFSGNFAPRGWFFCEGQYIDINQFTTLFAIIGNYYGGNGTTVFQLPDLRGRFPIHWGNSVGPGLDPNQLGDKFGGSLRDVNIINMPNHTHAVYAANQNANQRIPSDQLIPAKAYRGRGPVPQRTKEMYTAQNDTSMTSLNPAAVSLPTDPGPDNQYFDNYQPFQTCSFIINYDGIFPPRS